MEEIIVISMGGSLICPDRIDADFLRDFRKMILKQLEQGKRFILITGGGRTARNYQEAARSIGELSTEDIDWIGIESTRLNARLVEAMFHGIAKPDIIIDPSKKIDFKEKIMVAAGWKPGFSTDYDSVLLAKQFKVKKVINLTNTDYVYDKDPKQHSDAKPFKEISWKEFRKIVGNKWDPGLNAPFDPVASREAEKLKLCVAIINGKDLENLKKAIEGKEFVGTTIS
jgi:uridylate kinase